MMEIDTISVEDRKMHTFVFTTGANKGVKLSRVPAGRLMYLVRGRLPEWQWAEAELKRRGTTFPKLEVSNHAIDRASQRCLDIWRATRNEDEGLFSWLHRMALGAIVDGKVLESQERNFAGMRFCFGESGAWPILVTVKLGARSKSDAVRQAKKALRDAR